MIRIRVDSYQNILNQVDSGTIARILSDSDTEKHRRYHFDEDRNRFIAARVLFWQEIQDIADIRTILGLPVNFVYNSYGKPGLENVSKHFNWSHSGDLIALTISTEAVGIDVEQVPTRPLFEYKSLCTAGELSWIEKQIESGRLTEKEAFIVIWSAKEAVLKAIGTGLSTDPRKVGIEMDTIHPETWKCSLNQTTLNGTSAFFTFGNSGYALSWCTTKSDHSVEIWNHITNFR
jgi:phosphopantetheinyl transferase